MFAVERNVKEVHYIGNMLEGFDRLHVPPCILVYSVYTIKGEKLRVAVIVLVFS